MNEIMTQLANIQVTPQTGTQSTNSTLGKDTGKRFQDALQKASQKSNSSAANATNQSAAVKNDSGAQKVQNPADTSKTDGTQNAAGGQNVADGADTTNVETVRLVDASIGAAMGLQPSTQDNRADFLFSLFGVKMDESDMGKSDIDLLKSVMGKLNDPEAQFAAMLMMAFLQANPDYSLQDIQSAMSPDTLESQTISPMNKVMTAIMKIQSSDEDVKSSPLMDMLMNMGKTGSVKTVDMAQLLADVMDAKVQKNSTAQQNTQAQQQPMQSGQSDLAAQAQFKNAVMQARKMMEQEPRENRQDETKPDIDKLQSQVNAGTFLHNTAVNPLYRGVEAVKTGETLITPQELVNQVHTGIVTNLTDGKSEFIMKLNPEELGELTVKLVEIGGKMTLSIAAANVQTQKLLTSELANLQAVMKPLQVEVDPVVQQSQQAFAGTLFGGEAQQQTADSMFGEQQQASAHHHGTSDSQNQDDAEDLSLRQRVGVTNGLDAYI